MTCYPYFRITDILARQMPRIQAPAAVDGDAIPRVIRARLLMLRRSQTSHNAHLIGAGFAGNGINPILLLWGRLQKFELFSPCS
jgi:hypothetical protein